MRAADLTVYDGIPFSKLSGRTKIEAAKSKKNKNFNPYTVVALYWRDKIREDIKLTKRVNRNQIKFVFNENDCAYYRKFDKFSK